LFTLRIAAAMPAAQLGDVQSTFLAAVLSVLSVVPLSPGIRERKQTVQLRHLSPNKGHRMDDADLPEFMRDPDTGFLSIRYNAVRCTRCILSSAFPAIVFDTKGVCNYCSSTAGQSLRAAQHQDILAQVRQRIGAREGRSHDCLVLYSGGKDSSYSLYHITRVLGLRPLALTVDNGFVSDATLLNMKKLTTALRVDHLVVRPAPIMMRAIYHQAVRDTEPDRTKVMYATAACGSCISVVLATGAHEANIRRIPIMMGGWSPGQLTENPLLPGAFLEKISSGHLSRIHLSSPDARAQLDACIGQVSEFPGLYNPLYALQYSEERIQQKLAQFGWLRPADTDSCSSNCVLNGLLIVDHVRKYGFHPYEYELAFHVRNNLCSREEAIHKITQIGISDQQIASAAGRLGLEVTRS
jgi:hypothetical protein